MNFQYLTIEIWKSGKWFIAKAPEIDFISQGKTIEEAKKNLEEVIKIQFEEMEKMGTLTEYLSECGFKIRENELIPEKEIIGFEKHAVLVK